MTVVASSVGMLTSAVHIVFLAGSAATRVERAEPFRSIDIGIGRLRVPLPQISARPVVNVAVNGRNNAPVAIIERHACLLLVAEGDGRTYFCETDSGRLHSVSTNAVDYTIAPRGQEWEAFCRRPG